jgi:hypothetical protein
MNYFSYVIETEVSGRVFYRVEERNYYNNTTDKLAEKNGMIFDNYEEAESKALEVVEGIKKLMKRG